YILFYVCPSLSLPSVDFCLTIQPPPTSTLFPYTTLFRSAIRFAERERLADYHPAFAVNREDEPETSESYSRVIAANTTRSFPVRSEEHTSELQSRFALVCRHLLEKKKKV